MSTALSQPSTSSGSRLRTSATSRWHSVRPWMRPRSLEDGNADENDEDEEEAGNGNGNAGIDDEEDDDEDSLDDESRLPSTSGQRDYIYRASRNSSISSRRRMQLELVDVSSTSVSLAVIGPADESFPSNNQNLQPSHLHVRSSTTAGDGQYHGQSQNPPNISIKLNSAAWPHVFHSDASFYDATEVPTPGPSSSRSQAHSHTSPTPPLHSSAEEGPTSSASSILVWGLSPGVDYRIELGVLDEQDDDEEANELDETSDTVEAEEALQTVASGSRPTDNANEPDVPPPPYSSHDPSLAADASRDAEAKLRTILEQLRLSTKQAENALHSSIAAMRKQNDKLTREDQRQRQRIHMLEDSTTRLREVAAEEDAETSSIHEAIAELEETEQAYSSRLDRRRSTMEQAERNAKDASERDEAEIAELKARLDKANSTEETVLARKLKLERELLPMYNIQLATLEADVRRMVDDQRRHHALVGSGMHGFPFAHQGSAVAGIASQPGRASSLRLPNRNNHPASHQQQPQAAYSILQSLNPLDDGVAVPRRSFDEPSNSTSHTQQASPPSQSHVQSRSFLPLGMRKRSSSLVQQQQNQQAAGMQHTSPQAGVIGRGSVNSPTADNRNPSPGVLSPSSFPAISSTTTHTERNDKPEAAPSKPTSRFNFNSSWASKVVGSGKARKDTA